MHLCSGVRTSDTLQKLIIPNNKLRIDALWRIASIAIGHESLVLVDLRGIRLGVKDWKKAQEKTKFTRLQFKLDRPVKKRHTPNMDIIAADEEVDAEEADDEPLPKKNIDGEAAEKASSVVTEAADTQDDDNKYT